MKKILINSRPEDFKKIKPSLEDYYHIIISKGDVVQTKLFVPDYDVDSVIQKLSSLMDMRYKDNLIEVSTPDFVISSTLSREEKAKKQIEKTPVEQLIDSAKNYTALDYWSIFLTSIAGLIALTGLFLNNVAIIIGAMLLSPLLGPIHSFAIYAATGRIEDSIRSITLLIILLGSVFIITVIATFILSLIPSILPIPGISLVLTEEILLRTDNSPIYMIMAILLGIASMISIVKGYPEVIAGVAVAAALLPPLVVAGLTTVMSFENTASAVLITLDNVIGLIAGTLIATLMFGIVPRRTEQKSVAKYFIHRTCILILILIVILALLSLLS